MNETSLKTFIAIIETGSLVKASERLNITQSTVTMRLKALEAEVGQKLLLRQKSGVSLTAAGTKFLSYAQVIDGLFSQALRATSLPQDLSQIYNLGCSTSLWELGGRQLFDAMHNHEAGFALSVQMADENVLFEALNDGSIDMCLVQEPVMRKSQQAIRLQDIDLALYSDRKQTPLRFDKSYIYVDYGADFRRQHDEVYYDAGAARIGFNTPQLALSYLLDYGGSVYLPRALTKHAIEQGRLYEITKAPCFRLEKYLVIARSDDPEWQWLAPLLSHLSL